MQMMLMQRNVSVEEKKKNFASFKMMRQEDTEKLIFTLILRCHLAFWHQTIAPEGIT